MGYLLNSLYYGADYLRHWKNLRVRVCFHMFESVGDRYWLLPSRLFGTGSQASWYESWELTETGALLAANSSHHGRDPGRQLIQATGTILAVNSSQP